MTLCFLPSPAAKNGSSWLNYIINVLCAVYIGLASKAVALWTQSSADIGPKWMHKEAWPSHNELPREAFTEWKPAAFMLYGPSVTARCTPFTGRSHWERRRWRKTRYKLTQQQREKVWNEKNSRKLTPNKLSTNPNFKFIWSNFADIDLQTIRDRLI